MKIVAIKDEVDGNDSVGTMWQETKIFDSDTPLIEVMKWAGSYRRRIVLTIPEDSLEEFHKVIRKIPMK